MWFILYFTKMVKESLTVLHITVLLSDQDRQKGALRLREKVQF